MEHIVVRKYFESFFIVGVGVGLREMTPDLFWKVVAIGSQDVDKLPDRLWGAIDIVDNNVKNKFSERNSQLYWYQCR